MESHTHSLSPSRRNAKQQQRRAYKQKNYLFIIVFSRAAQNNSTRLNNRTDKFFVVVAMSAERYSISSDCCTDGFFLIPDTFNAQLFAQILRIAKKMKIVRVRWVHTAPKIITRKRNCFAIRPDPKYKKKLKHFKPKRNIPKWHFKIMWI